MQGLELSDISALGNLKDSLVSSPESMNHSIRDYIANQTRWIGRAGPDGINYVQNYDGNLGQFDRPSFGRSSLLACRLDSFITPMVLLPLAASCELTFLAEILCDFKLTVVVSVVMRMSDHHNDGQVLRT